MTFKEKLKQFKEDLSNSIYITPANRKLFEQIPDSFYIDIFRDNFNSDNELAKKVLFKEFKEINREDLEKQTKRIHNFKRAMKTIKNYIDSDKKLVFVTDIDNDGSLSQAIIYEFKRLFPEQSKNIHIVYSQNLNGNTNRGFTVDLLEKWADDNNISKDEDFLMLSADNGVNNRDEQEKIEKMFSKCNMVITDHHLPSEEEVIVDNKRTCLFNPKNKPISVFKGDKNISGAHTLGVLLQNTALEYNPEVNIRNFQNLCFGANLLDYVNTDIRLKPLESYMIDKFSELGALLNVNNSMSKIITGDTSIEYVESVIKNIPEIDRDEFMDALSVVEEQNLVAAKLLYIQKEYDGIIDEEVLEKLEKKSFYSKSIQVLVGDEKFEHFNKNYIEQLRPRIYHHAVNGDKSEYEVGIEEAMKDVFKKVQVAEKRLIKEMRKGDIMNTVKLDNSTLMYPKYPEINKLFNRKFLGKVFNEEINGFHAMFDGNERSKRTGSCRSLYNLSDILANTDSLPDYLDISFQGHEKAAGYFVERNDGKVLTDKDMKIVADYMQERIDVLKEDNKYSQKYVQVDFNNIGLIQDINRQVKAHVNNVSGINPVIKLNRSMHFTDKKSLKTISVGELLKKEKYGYTLLNLNFHGDTIIVPTEIVRQLAKNNFKDYLQINYMSEGAFIAYKVVKTETLKAKDLIRLDSPKKEEQEKITKYYKETFYDKDTFEKDIPRQVMKDVDFFKNNGRFGDGEFAAVEAFFIGLIDKYSANLEDKSKEVTMVIADTEANGLGKAPKLFNFGAFEVTIDPDSGTEIPLDQFMKQYSKNKTVLGAVPLNIKIDHDNNKVILNRRIKGKLVSMLIRDKDFKLTQEISALTGISQAMLNKYGVTTGEADVYLANRYKDIPCIFQAHNSNYDVGVLASNTPQFKNVLDQNMVCDSARFAKEQRLAYPDTYVTTLCHEASKAFFFNDPLADYSVSKLLQQEEDMQFPDIRGEYLVKTKGQDVFLINLKTDVEIKLPHTKEYLATQVNSRNTDLHLNMLKYSVVVLAKFENIRAAVLHDLEDTIKFVETPTEILDPLNCKIPFDEEMASKLYQEFCKDYHFDCNIRTNLEHFRDAIILEVKEGVRSEEELFLFCPELNQTAEEREEAAKAKKSRKKKVVEEDDEDAPKTFHDLFSIAAMKFLEENKELHLRFTTIWEYQKVLDVFDPDKLVKDLDPAVLKGISYNTGLPIDRIAIILDKVYNYKSAYKLENIYTEELHNNIDENGDAMIEGLLIAQRLMRKHYNSYAKQKNFATALDIYSRTLETTSHRNITRQHMETTIGEAKVNSYSQKQMETYSSRRVDGEGNVNLSPIILNAVDPKHTKWQLKILPPGSFIEARPDEAFILNKLFGKVETATFVSDIERINAFDFIDVEKIYEKEIQGKAAKLTPSMKEALADVNDELLDMKRREIVSKFGDLAKRKVIENLVETSSMNRNLKQNLIEVLEDEKNKSEGIINYLTAVLPNFQELDEIVNNTVDENFSEEQYDEAKTNNGKFLNIKKMNAEEKSEIERKMIFIANRLKVKNSIDKEKSMDTKEAIRKVIDMTEKTADQYLDDIQGRIGNLKFTRSENEIKKIVEQMWDSIQGKGRFIGKNSYHKEYYTPFYKNLLVEFKDLGTRLGLPFDEDKYEEILDDISKFKEPEYFNLEESMNAFSKEPSKYILEQTQELLREVLIPQVSKDKNEKILEINGITALLEKKIRKKNGVDKSQKI
jgi:hypothetical protein